MELPKPKCLKSKSGSKEEHKSEDTTQQQQQQTTEDDEEIPASPLPSSKRYKRDTERSEEKENDTPPAAAIQPNNTKLSQLMGAGNIAQKSLNHFTSGLGNMKVLMGKQVSVTEIVAVPKEPRKKGFVAGRKKGLLKK